MSDTMDVIAFLNLVRFNQKTRTRQVLIRKCPIDAGMDETAYTYAGQTRIVSSSARVGIPEILARDMKDMLGLMIKPEQLDLAYVGQDLEKRQLIMIFQPHVLLSETDYGGLDLDSDLLWCDSDSLPLKFETPSCLQLYQLCALHCLPPELS